VRSCGAILGGSNSSMPPWLTGTSTRYGTATHASSILARRPITDLLPNGGQACAKAWLGCACCCPCCWCSCDCCCCTAAADAACELSERMCVAWNSTAGVGAAPAGPAAVCKRVLLPGGRIGGSSSPMEFWRLTGCSSASPSLGKSDLERLPVRGGFRVAGCSRGGPPAGAGSALSGPLSVLELLPA
jgi:hypothetical protein